MPIESGYHTRGYLPHIKVPGAAYFVTFRLADSLPREVVVRLKEQREDLLHRIAKEAPGDEAKARRELFEWYADQVDSVLDQHTGAAWLRAPEVGNLVNDALQYFEGDRYRLHARCVMPNHVHVVVRPLGNHALDEILHSWKSLTAHEANKLIAQEGEFWQRESYDHWIRDDLDLMRCCAYTENNPVKARLCENPWDWPWSSAAKK